MPMSRPMTPNGRDERGGVSSRRYRMTHDETFKGESADEGKAAFELVLANDEMRVLEPRDKKIRTSQKSLPHSNFSWLQSPKNAGGEEHPRPLTARLIEAVDVLRANGVTPWLEHTGGNELEALQSLCKTWDDVDEF